MRVRLSVIAKKYAVAFLNLYFDQIGKGNIEKILKLEDFLKQNKMFYVYLRIPSISDFIKKKSLTRVAQEFGLSKPIIKLIFVLLEDGRIEILDKVLHYIVSCYRNLQDIKSFRITTSHVLSDSEKDSVIDFVKNLSKKDVITKFLIDPRLICGFRIQSKDFLWERSIAKQLRDIKKITFKQVGLW